jgi:hypothetical protein
MRWPFFLRLNHCAVSVVVNVLGRIGPSRIRIERCEFTGEQGSIQSDAKRCALASNVFEGCLDE